jgi:hypothetical protein
LVQRELKDGLGLRDDDDVYYIFRDQITGLEYLRNGRELCQHGFYIELGAYKYHAFMDWREVIDDEQRHYAQTAAYLQGGGVPSIDEAVRELHLRSVHGPFKELVNAGMFKWFTTERVREVAATLDPAVGDEVEDKATRLFTAIKELIGGTGDEVELARSVRADLDAVLQLLILPDRFVAPTARKYQTAVKTLLANLNALTEESPATKSKSSKAPIVRTLPADDKVVWGTLYGWMFVHSLGKMLDQAGFAGVSRTWIDEWLLSPIITAALREFGVEEGAARRAVDVIKVLTTHQTWFDAETKAAQRPAQVLETLLADDDARRFLNVNLYDKIEWYNKESFEELLAWLLLEEAVMASVEGADVPKTLGAAYDVVVALQAAEAKSEYQMEKLTAAVQPTPKTRTKKVAREE